MAIYQETSNIQTSTSSGLITSKRSIDTNVLVDDGQIIVLGGLIEDTLNDTVEKVPGLGDIPLLGYLFRYQSKRRGKTNLMVFIRPTVIRNDAQSAAVAGERYDYIRNAQLTILPEPNRLLPKTEPPLLPAWGTDRSLDGRLLPSGEVALPSAPIPTTPLPAEAPSPPWPVEPPVINQR
jgi:general secretion pathway protein D